MVSLEPSQGGHNTVILTWNTTRLCSFTSWFAPVDSVEPLDRVDDCLELLIGAEFIHGNLNLRAFGADARRDGHSAALAILELAHGIWYRWEYPVL